MNRLTKIILIVLVVVIATTLWFVVGEGKDIGGDGDILRQNTPAVAP